MSRPSRIRVPGRRQALRPEGFVVAAICLAVAACGETTTGADDDTGEPPTVSPGATLPLGPTVRVGTTGTYLLPAGAARLTTRCTGRVTVTFTPPGGPEQNNTCDSQDGSSSQTNDVTGVTSVVYTLDPGAYADVTVRSAS